MARVGLNPETVTHAAAHIVDAGGRSALTLARLAADLQVAAPSLYKHIAGLDDLMDRVTLLSIHQLADDLTKAALARSGRQALAAVSEAYRHYAVGHPGLYSLLQGPLRTEAVAQQADAARILATMEAVVRSYQVQDRLIFHAIRIVRSGLHGFCDLEIRGALQLPHSTTESFSLLVDALDASLNRLGQMD